MCYVQVLPRRRLTLLVDLHVPDQHLHVPHELLI